MSSSNTPIISPVSGVRSPIGSAYTKTYSNPHFDYLSEMLPKEIKDLFRWCEVVYNSMPSIANGIRKLVNYPVTEFVINNESETIRKETQDVLEKLNMKLALLEYGTDLYVYGNVFRSVYLPFVRYLKCARCGQETAIDAAKFKLQKKKFMLTCSCGHTGEGEIVDRCTEDISKVRIVRWDPKQIELKQNPITGATSYYYSVPKNIANGINSGDLTILADTPKVFIDAVLRGRNLKMGSNFHHGKTNGLAGYASGWGISPLMPVLKPYMHIAVLRRAQEAIGLEHITPKNILFPQTSGTSDPSIMTSMATWKKEMMHAEEMWRWDPNYIAYAPYPTGVVNVGSQGRGLSPTEEVKDTRMEMALALDIPPSIIMGDTNIQNSAVGLRILENQLAPQVAQLEEFAWWVLRILNTEFRKSYAKPELQPFRLADDLMNKQILMQMMGQAVSRSTMQKALGIDPDKERELLKGDQISDAKLQQEISQAVADAQNNLSQQAQQAEQQAIQGSQAPYDQQQILAQAQPIVEQMMQMDDRSRKSYMAQLQQEDYVMWAIVSKQLEFAEEQNKTMAYNQMRQQQQGGMQ